MLGDYAGVGQFAVRIFGVTHGKSFDRSAANFCHQCSHGAGINAAAEKDAERHIAHQMAAHRLLQHLPVGLDVVTLRLWRFGLRYRQIPIALNSDLPARVNFHPMTGHEFANSGVESLFFGEISEGQIFGKDCAIKLRAGFGAGENYFDL